MSDHEFENYLTLIGRLLRLSPTQREAIGEELRDHFESRLGELLEAGVAHDEAVRIALEEFGDAAGLAASFTRVSQTRRRRLIMRCTVGSIAAIAAAVVVAMAVWPENHAGRIVANAIAQTKESSKATQPERKKSIEELSSETAAKLNELTEAEFVQAPLKAALTYFCDKHQLQLYYHRSLTDAGLDPTAIPVSLNVHPVRLKTCLDWMLSENNLGYTIRDGVLVIATKDWLSVQLETRVYDCRDILASDAASTRAMESKPLALPPAPPNTSSARSEYLHLAQLGGPAPLPPTIPNSSAAERLTSLVRKTVAADTWSEVGGPGSIVEYQGLLIVSQTAEVQAQVRDLLDEISARLHAMDSKEPTRR
jgi:hypothetical protein